MHYKITLEYDGTNYVGWQMQKDQPNKSIEEILLNAIFAMTSQRVKINCAGRTDAGVHAKAQVADFFLEKEFSPNVIISGINNYLAPNNVALVNCEIVDDDFHSRFDAKMRHYEYRILNRKSRPILQKNRVCHISRKLDLQKMQQAAKYFLGTHDFSAFRDRKCQANSPIKTIEKLELLKINDEIKIEISANAFLHHMVRNIAGTLIYCGLGKIEPEKIPLIIASKNRSNSGANAPACGLYFTGTDY